MPCPGGPTFWMMFPSQRSTIRACKRAESSQVQPCQSISASSHHWFWDRSSCACSLQEGQGRAQSLSATGSAPRELICCRPGGLCVCKAGMVPSARLAWCQQPAKLTAAPQAPQCQDCRSCGGQQCPGAPGGVAPDANGRGHAGSFPGWAKGTARACSPVPTHPQGQGLTPASTQVWYLLHRLLQDPLQVPPLDANHEGRGAADSVQQALRDHRDVGVSPGEGVEESSNCMDAL